MVREYGADVRTYEMFMGAFDQPIPWSTGACERRRFLSGYGGCGTVADIPLDNDPLLRPLRTIQGFRGLRA